MISKPPTASQQVSSVLLLLPREELERSGTKQEIRCHNINGACKMKRIQIARHNVSGITVNTLSYRKPSTAVYCHCLNNQHCSIIIAFQNYLYKKSQIVTIRRHRFIRSIKEIKLKYVTYCLTKRLYCPIDHDLVNLLRRLLFLGN